VNPVHPPKRASLVAALFSLPLLLIPTAGFAVEPGVDIAAPRVAISQVADAFTFQPAALVIEQGDYVCWLHVGVSFTHTTTSGFSCAANGFWNANLVPGGRFMRQFLETPQVFPYYCTPHCFSGMTGQVTVTSRIVVQAADSSGQLVLTWTGGGSTYRVYRSNTPLFTGAGTVILAPDAGDSGKTFTDTAVPGVGAVAYYLVMNKF